MMHLKILEEQEPCKHKSSSQAETVIIRAEINYIENKGTIQGNNITNSRFFEKANKQERQTTD